jgi:hypothetical protein
MTEVSGPIDFLILEVPAAAAGTASAQALGELLDRDVLRLYDLMAVHRADDGSCREVELADGPFAAFAGARSGLLGGDDLEEAANALKPGTDAVIVLYENHWAVPFVAAARSEGIEVVASARLSAQEIMAALDAVESDA